MAVKVVDEKSLYFVVFLFKVGAMHTLSSCLARALRGNQELYTEANQMVS